MSERSARSTSACSSSVEREPVLQAGERVGERGLGEPLDELVTPSRMARRSPAAGNRIPTSVSHAAGTASTRSRGEQDGQIRRRHERELRGGVAGLKKYAANSPSQM